MVRLIKRYGGGSRKLYDTEESRYVSLDELAGWVRRGQQLKVVDSASAEDVTAQTLAQVIYEVSKRGASPLSSEFLHELIRRSGQALGSGVNQVRQGMDRLVRASVDRLPPVRVARREMDALRESLATLQHSIADLERAQRQAPRPKRRRNEVGRKTDGRKASRRNP
jgi:polyhydroxyalkanoate synthesis repressor PhaR